MTQNSLSTKAQNPKQNQKQSKKQNTELFIQRDRISVKKLTKLHLH